MNNLYKKIDMATVVSFDIFDTLLLRPFCDPKDVFAYIEQKYNKVGFKKERILAEKRARKKKTEVTIEDIYFEMPMFSEFQEIELDVEKQYLYKNEEVSELYKYAQLKNKKIIIVSDIYLHETFISEVLDKNGYTGYEKLYISCEYQRTKNDGSLFDVVLNDYPLNENQIIHIGDNVTSDYIQPKSHGIIGINIPKVIDRYFQFRSFRSKDAETLVGSVFVKMCADRLRQGYDNYWHRFGFEFAGPICFAFSKWIFDSLAKLNSEISDICFVA